MKFFLFFSIQILESSDFYSTFTKFDAQTVEKEHKHCVRFRKLNRVYLLILLSYIFT